MSSDFILHKFTDRNIAIIREKTPPQIQKAVNYLNVLELTCEQNEISSALKKVMNRLGEISTRNVNKRINRKISKINLLESKVETLETQNFERSEKNENYEELNNSINFKLSSALKSNSKCRKKVFLWKKRLKILNNC